MYYKPRAGQRWWVKIDGIMNLVRLTRRLFNGSLWEAVGSDGSPRRVGSFFLICPSDAE